MSAVASIRRHPRGGYTWMYWEDWSTTTAPEPGDAAIRYDTIDEAMTAAGIPAVLHYELWPDAEQAEPEPPAHPQKTRVYLAGPMRGYPQYNFPAFFEAAQALREAGYDVWSPAEHDAEAGFKWDDKTGVEDLDGEFDLKAALAHDLKMVTEWADIVALLPGWEESKGTRAELAAAAALGKEASSVEALLEGVEGPGTVAGALEWAMSFDGGHNTTLGYVTYDGVTEPLKPGKVIHVSRPDEVRVTSDTGGQKGSKPARFDLIPKTPLWQVAELYGRGAQKYEDRNWERGYDWHLSFAALNRHLWQFWSGEDDDTETGAPHLASVIFHAMAMMEWRYTHPEFDDRPKAAK